MVEIEPSRQFERARGSVEVGAFESLRDAGENLTMSALQDQIDRMYLMLHEHPGDVSVTPLLPQETLLDPQSYDRSIQQALDQVTLQIPGPERQRMAEYLNCVFYRDMLVEIRKTIIFRDGKLLLENGSPESRVMERPLNFDTFRQALAPVAVAIGVRRLAHRRQEDLGNAMSQLSRAVDQSSGPKLASHLNATYRSVLSGMHRRVVFDGGKISVVPGDVPRDAKADPIFSRAPYKEPVAAFQNAMGILEREWGTRRDMVTQDAAALTTSVSGYMRQRAELAAGTDQRAVQAMDQRIAIELFHDQGFQLWQEMLRMQQTEIEEYKKTVNDTGPLKADRDKLILDGLEAQKKALLELKDLLEKRMRVYRLLLWVQRLERMTQTASDATFANKQVFAHAQEVATADAGNALAQNVLKACPTAEWRADKAAEVIGAIRTAAHVYDESLARAVADRIWIGPDEQVNYEGMGGIIARTKDFFQGNFEGVRHVQVMRPAHYMRNIFLAHIEQMRKARTAATDSRQRAEQERLAPLHQSLVRREAEFQAVLENRRANITEILVSEGHIGLPHPHPGFIPTRVNAAVQSLRGDSRQGLEVINRYVRETLQTDRDRQAFIYSLNKCVAPKIFVIGDDGRLEEVRSLPQIPARLDAPITAIIAIVTAGRQVERHNRDLNLISFHCASLPNRATRAAFVYALNRRFAGTPVFCGLNADNAIVLLEGRPPTLDDIPPEAYQAVGALIDAVRSNPRIAAYDFADLNRFLQARAAPQRDLFVDAINRCLRGLPKIVGRQRDEHSGQRLDVLELRDRPANPELGELNETVIKQIVDSRRKTLEAQKRFYTEFRENVLKTQWTLEEYLDWYYFGPALQEAIDQRSQQRLTTAERVFQQYEQIAHSKGIWEGMAFHEGGYGVPFTQMQTPWVGIPNFRSAMRGNVDMLGLNLNLPMLPELGAAVYQWATDAPNVRNNFSFKDAIQSERFRHAIQPLVDQLGLDRVISDGRGGFKAYFSLSNDEKKEAFSKCTKIKDLTTLFDQHRVAVDPLHDALHADYSLLEACCEQQGNERFIGPRALATTFEASQPQWWPETEESDAENARKLYERLLLIVGGENIFKFMQTLPQVEELKEKAIAFLATDIDMQEALTLALKEQPDRKEFNRVCILYFACLELMKRRGGREEPLTDEMIKRHLTINENDDSETRQRKYREAKWVYRRLFRRTREMRELFNPLHLSVRLSVLENVDQHLLSADFAGEMMEKSWFWDTVLPLWTEYFAPIASGSYALRRIRGKPPLVRKIPVIGRFLARLWTVAQRLIGLPAEPLGLAADAVRSGGRAVMRRFRAPGEAGTLSQSAVARLQRMGEAAESAKLLYRPEFQAVAHYERELAALERQLAAGGDDAAKAGAEIAKLLPQQKAARLQACQYVLGRNLTATERMAVIRAVTTTEGRASEAAAQTILAEVFTNADELKALLSTNACRPLAANVLQNAQLPSRWNVPMRSWAIWRGMTTAERVAALGSWGFQIGLTAMDVLALQESQKFADEAKVRIRGQLAALVTSGVLTKVDEDTYQYKDKATVHLHDLYDATDIGADRNRQRVWTDAAGLSVMGGAAAARWIAAGTRWGFRVARFATPIGLLSVAVEITLHTAISAWERSDYYALISNPNCPLWLQVALGGPSGMMGVTTYSVLDREFVDNFVSNRSPEVRKRLFFHAMIESMGPQEREELLNGVDLPSAIDTLYGEAFSKVGIDILCACLLTNIESPDVAYRDIRSLDFDMAGLLVTRASPEELRHCMNMTARALVSHVRTVMFQRSRKERKELEARHTAVQERLTTLQGVENDEGYSTLLQEFRLLTFQLERARTKEFELGAKQVYGRPLLDSVDDLERNMAAHGGSTEITPTLLLATRMHTTLTVAAEGGTWQDIMRAQAAGTIRGSGRFRQRDTYVVDGRRYSLPHLSYARDFTIDLKGKNIHGLPPAESGSRDHIEFSNWRLWAPEQTPVPEVTALVPEVPAPTGGENSEYFDDIYTGRVDLRHRRMLLMGRRGMLLAERTGIGTLFGQIQQLTAFLDATEQLPTLNQSLAAIQPRLAVLERAYLIQPTPLQSGGVMPTPDPELVSLRRRNTDLRARIDACNRTIRDTPAALQAKKRSDLLAMQLDLGKRGLDYENSYTAYLHEMREVRDGSQSLLSRVDQERQVTETVRAHPFVRAGFGRLQRAPQLEEQYFSDLPRPPMVLVGGPITERDRNALPLLMTYPDPAITADGDTNLLAVIYQSRDTDEGGHDAHCTYVYVGDASRAGTMFTSGMSFVEVGVSKPNSSSPERLGLPVWSGTIGGQALLEKQMQAHMLDRQKESSERFLAESDPQHLFYRAGMKIRLIRVREGEWSARTADDRLLQVCIDPENDQYMLIRILTPTGITPADRTADRVWREMEADRTHGPIFGERTLSPQEEKDADAFDAWVRTRRQKWERVTAADLKYFAVFNIDDSPVQLRALIKEGTVMTLHAKIAERLGVAEDKFGRGFTEALAELVTDLKREYRAELPYKFHEIEVELDRQVLEAAARELQGPRGFADTVGAGARFRAQEVATRAAQEINRRYRLSGSGSGSGSSGGSESSSS